MNKLIEFKPLLKEIIDGISNIINLECAIFDTAANLIASTDTYLKRKGYTVHAPSIDEVITNGNVLVNRPGYMKSCFGCRFKDNCPATIEILNCIRINDNPVGVIAITSFTKSGHDRIMENISNYTRILNNFTDMLAGIIASKENMAKTTMLKVVMQSLLNFSEDGMIIIDEAGCVSYCNPNAVKLFSTCSLYTLTLQQIFPEHINFSIMKGEKFHNRPIKINNERLFFSCYPMIHNNDFFGAIIRLNHDKSQKPYRKPITSAVSRIKLDSIKGCSSSINEIKLKARKISDSISTVLITGETGTGKSLLAKAIHFESCRANGPFIIVNCACIPQTLFESELFGYEEGAFTGAKKGGKPGWFELAQSGTLFLDEIGGMPLAMQTKLLDVLQERTIERVGGINTIPLDVRVITATNSDIEDLIKEDLFRQDLYYRINVIPLYLPPLRDRTSDIEYLAHEFLIKYNSQLNKNIPGFEPDVMEFFHNYSWPGNVRELENIVEYALNMTDKTITFQDIPIKYSGIGKYGVETVKSKVESIEYEIIKAAIDKYGWDVKGKTAAAEELGIGLRTLYRKLKTNEGKIE